MKQAKLYHHERLLCPHRTVVINPPKGRFDNKTKKQIEQDYSQLYQFINIHEYHYAGEYLLAWEGIDFKGKHTSLFKIQNKDYDRWAQRMRDLKIVENIRGASTVQGCYWHKQSGRLIFSDRIPV